MEAPQLYSIDEARTRLGKISRAKIYELLNRQGADRDILARRHTLYLSAREANPRRWARHTRNWNPIAAVTLNPEEESVVGTALAAGKVTASAA